ncbi:MAG: phosphoserine phosphatase [Burkholderiales bacterium PBB4]|nr:MAG: phosphoserine phosphatase [Burkholderiales bacterium PBB4]
MTHPETPKPRVALFDLDHTLLPLDSDHAWGDYLIGLGWVDALEYKRRNDAFYEDYKASKLNLAEYIQFSTAAVVKQGAARSQAAHAGFMADVVHKALLPQALQLVQAHRAADDAVLIVTATNEFVTRPIADAFGVQDLIAVELERDEAAGGTGWYTGAIRGVPSYQAGKVTRVAAWLQARGWDWADVHTTFYSDSPNDLPLLEKVDVPIATNPDPRLREIALSRGWRILDLFR